MTSTVVVRGTGSALFEMDIPPAGLALELFEEKLAKGEIVIVTDPVEWVDAGEGARKLQLVSNASPEAPSVAPDAPRRGRPPKVQAPAESAVEATPDTEE